MRPDAVARRYARALFSLAKEQAALDTVGVALATIAEILSDPNAMRVLTGPVAKDRKHALLTKIIETTHAPDTVRDFLFLLADHARLNYVPRIRSVFEGLLDRERGIVRATIHTAAALSPDIFEEITRTFSGITGRQVVADVEIVPDLIAGVIVEVEGRVYDGSARAELVKLQQRMATGS